MAKAAVQRLPKEPQVALILPPNERFAKDYANPRMEALLAANNVSRFSPYTTVYGRSGNQPKSDLPYKDITLGKKILTSSSASYIKQLKKQLSEQNPEIVEVMDSVKLLHGLRDFVRDKLKASLVFRLSHDPSETDILRTSMQRYGLLKECDAIFCESLYIRSRLLEGLDAMASDEELRRAVVVRDGITIPSRLPEKERLIVLAAPLKEKHGVRLFFDAIKMIFEQNDEWNVAVMGDDEIGYHDLMKGWDKGLSARVRHLKNFDEKVRAEWFGKAGMVVLPQENERMASIALEAMAHGAAVVASELPAMNEFTAKSAVSFRTRTPQSLSGLMMQMINDEVRWRRTGMSCRNQMQHFEQAEMVRQMDLARLNALGVAISRYHA